MGLHVASPFPLGEPQHEDDLIRPAVDGTLRVLRAAARAGVRRVVQTSSIAAIAFGHPRGKRNFDETDWSNLDAPVGTYMKSKTLAERAAWDFINGPENVNHMEMAAINPGLILTGDWVKTATQLTAGTGRTAQDYLDDIAKKNAPIGRFATPEELAQFFVFMCSPRSSYCVGSTYYVDGGWLNVVA